MLTFVRDQASIVESITSRVRSLPKVDRREVICVIVLARDFNEVHTLVDVV